MNMAGLVAILAFALVYVGPALGGTVIYEGRAPLTLTDAALDTSSGPYLT